MLGWELPPHNSGGLGVACYHMSKALAMKGASIDFVVPYRAEHPNSSFMRVHAATNLSPLHHYGFGAYDTYDEMSLSRKQMDGQSLRDIQARYVAFVEEFVADSDYDAIHAHDWLTLEAGVRVKELTGKPLVAHVHATEFDRSGGGYGNPLVHEIEYDGLMMADRIIAVSELTKQLIVKHYHIPADKIEVVHNGLDTESLAGFEYDWHTYRYLEELKNHGHIVVATVTRFTIQKGLTYLMQAAARASEKYDKLVFLFAGDGEQRDELLRLSAELGISDKVFFTGFVRGKQWRDAYRVADVFVMSSVSEPFGITALEAAYYEDAVILTKQSGVGEALHNVLRYDFWDVDRLADQLVAVAASPALRDSLKENVRAEYTRLSWHVVADRCLALYHNLRPLIGQEAGA